MIAEVVDRDCSYAIATLGALLLDAGESVTTVRSTLQSVCAAQGVKGAQISVLPTLVLITDQSSGRTVSAASGAELSFREAATANQVPSRLSRGELRLNDMTAIASEIRERGRPRSPMRTILGNAVVAAAFSALFQAPWWAITTAFVVGVLAGMLMSVFERSRPGVALQPFLISFISTALIGTASKLLAFPTIPLFAVVAPVAILVPGAVIAKALLELTSTDIVAGSARFLGGLIMMGFMTAGIAAGSTLTGLDVDPVSGALIGDISISPGHPGWETAPPLWFAWLSVIGLAVGVNIMFQSGLRLTLASAAIMCTAYGATQLFSPVLGATVAIGAGTALVFLAAQSVERLRPAFPASMTFFPAFLLFVPGSLALVSLAMHSEGAVMAALASFASMCIGIHVGGLVDLWLDKTLWKQHRERTASCHHDTH